ncbi:ABC transporter permease [Actinomycetaceae bacterium MB13-C1-2]|nr:ABC transporter permease [Actinomycetaceae bacterium MB13-C1-2]
MSIATEQSSKLQESDIEVEKPRILGRFHSPQGAAVLSLVLVALVVVFSLLSPHFFTLANLYQILLTTSVVVVLAAGQTFVIVTGGIDLSQGSMVGLCGVVAALIMTGGGSVFLGILASLAVGAGVGALNAFMVTRMNLPPFIATLGTMSIAQGMALIITGGQPVFGLPKSFSGFGPSGVGGFLPNVTIIMIVMVVLLHFYLSRTKTGRYINAIGSNDKAARLAGVPIKRNLFKAYILSATMAAVGGLILLAWTNSGVAAAGTGREMQSIAAVVIGGASLAGGAGSVLGALIGALLMAVLSNGTQLLGMSSYLQVVLLGLVVILAVYVDQFRNRSSS